MLNGITYMVRPVMQLVKTFFSVARISAGSAQLLVGPASSLVAEQMKVRSSTRATSEGWVRARKLLGRFSSLSGVRVPASSSPHVVPRPYSVAENVDPEEAFVAALSSCHMLTFLWLAAKAGYRVESYRDDAVGIMAKNGQGRLAMTRVTLRPRVIFGGEQEPALAALEQLHHQAHEECFIANSVNTVVTTEIVI